MNIPEYIDPELWRDFLENRAALKKKCNTERAVKMLLNKLTKFHHKGHDVNEIMETSIISGWIGVFEPRGVKTHETHRRVSTVDRANQKGREYMHAHGIPELEDII